MHEDFHVLDAVFTVDIFKAGQDVVCRDFAETVAVQRFENQPVCMGNALKRSDERIADGDDRIIGGQLIRNFRAGGGNGIILRKDTCADIAVQAEAVFLFGGHEGKIPSDKLRIFDAAMEYYKIKV